MFEIQVTNYHTHTYIYTHDTLIHNKNTDKLVNSK